MDKIMVLVNKVITWIKMNFATVFGLAQAVIKALKEIATGLINLLSIFAFTASAEAIIVKVRGFFELLDTWLEIAKTWLLANVVK